MPTCNYCKISDLEMQSKKICKRCAAKRKIYQSKYYKNNKKQFISSLLKYQSSTRGRFNRAKLKASKRNIPFELTIEEYGNSINLNCFYCDGYFGKVLYGSGLDRINNDLGYTTSNVCSCCKFCNSIKSNCLTFNETKIIIGLLIQMRKS